MRYLFTTLLALSHGIYQQQRHSQVAYLLQYFMQFSLVNHQAGQERIAVLFQRDGQPLEPIRPLLAQMSLYPDWIDLWLVNSAFRIVFVYLRPIPQ